MIKAHNLWGYVLTKVGKLMAFRIRQQLRKIHKAMPLVKAYTKLLVILYLLRTMLFSNPPQDISNASDLMDTCFASVMLAIRTTSSRALDYQSTGALIFDTICFLIYC
jgi:hypothetical protein